MEHVVLVCERYEQQRGKMVDVVRLEMEVWMGDADEWTTEEWVRLLFGFGDRVSDAVVGVVKEFLDRVWRIRDGE